MRTCLLLFLLGSIFGRARGQEYPKAPPQLDPPRSGADVISGKSGESAWPVRIKVFNSTGHVIQQRDVLVNPSDSSIVAGFPSMIEAGQVVQAYFLQGTIEIMPSPPLLVSPAVHRATAERPAVTALPQASPLRIRGELAPGTTNVYVDATPTLPNSSYEVRISACPDGVPAGIRDSSGFKPYAVTDAAGQASITFEAPLASGQSVDLCQKIVNIADPSIPAIDATGSGPIPVANPLDLGRVRYYFTAGVMLSNDQGFQLSSGGTQAALFVDLDADRTWLALDSTGFRRANVNTYLDVQLASVPTQQPQAGTTLDSFIQSQKAASFKGGVYFPLVVGQPWSTAGNRYSLFVAPVAQTGFTTLTSAPAAAASITDRFYKSYSFGTRLGIFHHFHSAAAAPELISYLDITRGRFGNFEAFRNLSSGLTPDLLLERPWRYSLEGLFKVPHSPFVLGFSANIGTGGTPGYTEPRDDLRFLFGAQFDLSKLLSAIPQF
jgi:hypothetical protein